MRILGWNILVIAIYFGYVMTEHFGSNFLPQSKEEVLCDLVTLILGIIAYTLITRKKPIYFE